MALAKASALLHTTLKGLQERVKASPDLGNSSHESSARQLHRELQKVVALSKVQPHVDLDPFTEKVAKSQQEAEELLKLVGVAVLVKQKGVVEGLMAAYNQQQQQQSPAISNWIEKFESLMQEVGGHALARWDELAAYLCERLRGGGDEDRAGPVVL